VNPTEKRRISIEGIVFYLNIKNINASDTLRLFDIENLEKKHLVVYIKYKQ